MFLRIFAELKYLHSFPGVEKFYFMGFTIESLFLFACLSFAMGLEFLLCQYPEFQTFDIKLLFTKFTILH